MNRLTLRFADADAEAAFTVDQARKALRPARIALIWVPVLVTLYYLLTIHVFHGLFVGIGERNMLRLTIWAITLCALAYGLTRHVIFLTRHQTIMFLVACVLSAGFARGSLLLPVEVLEARGFIIMVMHMYIVYGLFGLRFPQASLAGWLSAVVFVVMLLDVESLSSVAIGRSAFLLALANCFGMLICYQMDSAARREFTAMRLLGQERERAERLLLNILPAPIAQRLKASEESIAEHSEGVTVLFADIVDFTKLSEGKTPQALVELLNRIFSEFDALAEQHGLEKIKTIGDAYMAVAGLPHPYPDHAARAARMALAMLDAVARVSATTGEDLSLRIGLHSGPVVAGVIGRRKFTYDLWGDTVNVASRMESHGLAGTIQCSEATAAMLEGVCGLQARGSVEIKGKGTMNTYFVSQIA